MLALAPHPTSSPTAPRPTAAPAGVRARGDTAGGVARPASRAKRAASSAARFALFALGAYAAWGVLLAALEVPAASHRLGHVVGALTTTLAAATWTAWGRRREERLLSEARERVREEEVALREERWRAAQAEGLAAFARILAHELRNPLHAMALHGVVVKRAAARLGPDGEPIRAAAAVLDGQMRRVNDLLDTYLALATTGAAPHAAEPLALDELAEDALAAHRAALDLRGVACRAQRGPGAPVVHGDRARLAQALHHLLENAADALPDGGVVEVHTAAEGDHVLLTITDDGPGLPDPEAAFRPFFTTRRAAGLGLAVVRDIVRAHRGEVSAENLRPRGARVTVRLPRWVPARVGAP